MTTSIIGSMEFSCTQSTLHHLQKEGTTMNVIDRIILSSIAFGIWAWVLITFLSGEHIDC
jgi:hypothetical protein